ncbi:hypothetical protein [Cognatilysobacter lacus]|uniref:Beta-barrel assembly machine subunit BamC n=1 Tax=Cognatilysobacter lacus TaxID=1643323 RepID=A0A5D8ZD43_9GAMM|nr:hypothetical protein [Lysobacter lacus]TZF90574.1 hypothetical protein FW784_04755 [Lysobacter lacus]
MSQLSNVVRATLLTVAITATSSGCGWFHKGSKLYAGPVESRALEVPPDLDTSTASGATSASSVTSSAAQQSASQSSSLGFTVAGSRDEVFAKLGTALAAVPGASIANRAPLIGAYDVNYAGSNFLVRVAAGTGGNSYVAAVDPRGLPATGDAAKRLVAALKAALAP